MQNIVSALGFHFLSLASLQVRARPVEIYSPDRSHGRSGQLICPRRVAQKLLQSEQRMRCRMPGKKHMPEEIIGKLHEVEIMLAQVALTTEACPRIAASEEPMPVTQRIWGPEDRPGVAHEESGEREADRTGSREGKLPSPARRRRCIDQLRRNLPVRWTERWIFRVLGQHRAEHWQSC